LTPVAVCGGLPSPSILTGKPSFYAGTISGGGEKRFYRKLIDQADTRYNAHLARIKQQKQKERR
jgi:hypothetical protein